MSMSSEPPVHRQSALASDAAGGAEAAAVGAAAASAERAAERAAPPGAPAARARDEKLAERRDRVPRRGRRTGRDGLGRRRGDRSAGAAAEGLPDRRRARSLAEQRRQWAEVRRAVARAELEPFRELVQRLAQVAFGPAATVMPHLRRSRGRQYLVLVVDAACPEATTNYADFLPMERAFWTAYATVPKPPAAFVVAVRPARGWCRSEALMPLFTQFGTADVVT